MAVVVDKEKCVGCGVCVPTCSVDALRTWGVVSVDEEACFDCLVCVPHCPADALKA
ncbi:MAG: 4Fe-4S dicluster domain-containing protein [Chloroflexota bacterium]|nr:MAG: 4Fe-4S dicluster domain-containing protein [Chloroflexota bacterium]